MDNLVNDTNSKLQEIVANLTTIKEDYEKKLEKNSKEIKVELEKVKKYKEDFFEAKEKIDKMNDDIEGFEEDYQYDKAWLTVCRDKLKNNGTIWISGTYHNIFSVARCLSELNFRILNCITWEKTAPPPNLSCRFFTHSAEYILWARKDAKTPHCFNYELMKDLNGGSQMRDVWRLPSIAPWEKSCGKHPTQKPLCVLSRIILASTVQGAWILDPFAGSSTTGIAANLLGRRFLGTDMESKFLDMSVARKREIEKDETRRLFLEKLNRQSRIFPNGGLHVLEQAEEVGFSSELPF